MLEKKLEQYLFASRWFIAPFYFLLATSVLLLLIKFIQEFTHFSLNFLSFTDTAAILGLLSLIDLTLMANLLVIVVFSGYIPLFPRSTVRTERAGPNGWERSTSAA